MIVMKVSDMIKKVEESVEFKEWKDDSSYLVHLFKMFEKDDTGYQLGYYIPDHDKVVAIEAGEKISISDEQDIFKKDGKVKKLEIEDVKVDIDEALVKAKELQKEKYAGQEPVKVILVLQKIDDSLMYNITYVTRNFKTLNIKVDASTGEVLSDGLTSVFSFK